MCTVSKRSEMRDGGTTHAATTGQQLTFRCPSVAVPLQYACPEPHPFILYTHITFFLIYLLNLSNNIGFDHNYRHILCCSFVDITRKKRTAINIETRSVVIVLQHCLPIAKAKSSSFTPGWQR